MISPIKKTPNGKRRLSRVERRAIALEEKAEARIEHIRQNPRLDRYGRPVVDGTPLGSGDKSWRLHYGFAGYESAKTPILGIGIPRDSFLPQECRDNEKNAFRDTPRSSKLTKEIKKWAKKYKFDKDPDFMKNLRMVRKRVQNIKTLKLSKQLESELKPMIFKFASYKLLDKRNPNAHFGSSTRVQMTNATLWNSMGDPGGESACNTTYRPNYTFMDEQRPRTPFGTASREQMTKAQLWAAMGLTGEASTEATYDKNYSLTDERQPAFSFGVSARPSPVLKTGAHEAPIYMVPIEKTPKFCKYFEHGPKFQSFGPKKRTKPRIKKPTEWGPPPPKKGEVLKLNPTRYGKYLATKKQPLQYRHYRYWG